MLLDDEPQLLEGCDRLGSARLLRLREIALRLVRGEFFFWQIFLPTRQPITLQNALRRRWSLGRSNSAARLATPSKAGDRHLKVKAQRAPQTERFANDHLMIRNAQAHERGMAPPQGGATRKTARRECRARRQDA